MPERSDGGGVPLSPAVGWAAVPDPPPAAPAELPTAVREVLAAALVSVGPLVRSAGMVGSQRLLIAGTAVGGSLALCLVGRWHWLPRLVVPALAAAALHQTEGKLVALWVAGALLASEWGLRRRPPLPRMPSPSPRAAAPVLVLLAFATWRGSNRASHAVPMILLCLTFVAIAADTVLGERFERATRAIGRTAGGVVGRITFGVLGMAAIVVPWPIHRLLGVDPVRPRIGGGGWMRSSGRRDPRPASPWAEDSVPRRRSRGERARSWLASGLTVTVLVALASAVQVPLEAGGAALDRVLGSVDRSIEDASTDDPFEEQWERELDADWNWINQSGPDGGFEPLSPYRIRDVRSRHMNISDGVRRSWQPPACACRRLEVWMYGGSTTFGLGQRDGHTIASELARTAHERGLVIDIANRGVVGDLHWQESVRFGWDLAASKDLPDLVIFYDGYNDLRGATHRNDEGNPGDDTPVDVTAAQTLHDFMESLPPTSTIPGARARFPARPEHGFLSDSALAAKAVRRYARAIDTTRRLADSHGVPLTLIWQPAAPDAGHMLEGMAPVILAVDDLPPGVHDLRDAFDGVAEEHFYDEAHHDEVAARVAAAAIFELVEPELRRAAGADR